MLKYNTLLKNNAFLNVYRLLLEYILYYRKISVNHALTLHYALTALLLHAAPIHPVTLTLHAEVRQDAEPQRCSSSGTKHFSVNFEKFQRRILYDLLIIFHCVLTEMYVTIMLQGTKRFV